MEELGESPSQENAGFGDELSAQKAPTSSPPSELAKAPHTGVGRQAAAAAASAAAAAAVVVAVSLWMRRSKRGLTHSRKRGGASRGRRRRHIRRQNRRHALDTRLLLLRSRPRPHTAAAALSLLPASPEPLSLFQGPLLDLWFLGFEVCCCRDSLSSQQVQQRLRTVLGAPILGALGAPNSLAFKSYDETRGLLLQKAGYYSQGPLCVAAAAEELEGQCLTLMDAVGKLLLLQLLHRRALKVYALYEQGPPRPLTDGALTNCLLKAIVPSAAAAAADLLLVLQQQQQQQLSFEAVGSLLLRTSCGRKGPLGAPSCSVSFPAFRCLTQGQPSGGPLAACERRGAPLRGPLQPTWDEAPETLKRLEVPLGAPNEGPPESLFSPPKRRRLAWV
ncbi:hypothetical protein Emed_006868 [Eimeria media]